MKVSQTLFFVLPMFFAHSLTAQLAWPRTLLETEFSGNINSVDTTDLDGDGKLDLLMTFTNADRVGWLRNLGGDSFSELIFLDGAPDGPILAHAGDLDGDGDADPVAFAHIDQKLFWWENDGQGNFGPARLLLNYVADWQDFRFHDLDIDGDLDLIVSSGIFSSTQVYWVANDGQGNFGAGGETLFDPLYGAALFCVADLDGDQLPDIVVGSSYLEWVRNLGDGNFSSRMNIPGASSGIGNPALADFDLDGDVDLLVPFPGQQKLSVFWNDGNGQFPSSQVVADAEIIDNNFSLHIQAGDLSGDGAPDVALWIDNRVKWLLNDGSGQLAPRNMNFPNTGANNFGRKLADLNNDGRPDLLSGSGNNISWMENLGQGAWRESVSVYPKFDLIISMDGADLDSDGDEDLLAASFNNNRLAWFPQEAPGEYGKARTIFGAAIGAAYISSGDLDGDGDDDVVAAAGISNEVFWFANDGGGNFEQGILVMDSLVNADAVQPVDLNQDGTLDLLISYDLGISHGWLPNLGNGQFGEFIPLSGPPFPPAWSLLAADFDQDGDIDLVSNNFSLLWHPNDGSGQFNTAEEILADSEHFGLIAADLDNDGYPGLVLYNNNGGQGSIVWIPNRDGAFEEGQVVIITPFNHRAASLLDFDGDGDLDMAFRSSAYPYGIYQALNEGNGRFGEPSLILNAPNAREVLRSTDMDGDGDPDLAFAGDGQISWLENLSGDAYLSGYVFWDENSNGQKDSSEIKLRGVPLKLLPEALYTYTDGQGNFRFYVAPGDYTLTFEPSKCWSLSTDSTVYQVAFEGEPREYAFGFQLKDEPAFPRASIASSPTRCGFTVPFWLTLYNDGCGLPGGLFAVAFDTTLLTLISAEPPPAMIDGDTLWWDYSLLEPGAFQSIKLLCEVAGVEFLGDSIRLSGITYLEGEEGQLLATDTTFYASQINCAYDPNDKLVDLSSIRFPADTAQQLHYTIRFQNTGTDTAFTVRIRDTLDANLDWASFRPLGSSHPYEASLDQLSGAVEFAFRNILLPDSTTNEPGSHGYVSFSIRLKASLPEGQRIANRAAIYFDFNPPIFTNTVESKLEQPVQVIDPAAYAPGLEARVFPNPTSGSLCVQFLAPLRRPTDIQVIAADGRTLAAQMLLAGVQEGQFSIAQLPPGLYWLWARQGESFYRIGSIIRQ